MMTNYPELNLDDLSSDEEEILETLQQILTSLDSDIDDLHKIRPISKSFSIEDAQELLCSGTYRNSKRYLNASTSEDVERLFDLMENGLLHQSIFQGDLCVKINETVHPTFQTFIFNYGFRISDLNLNCHILAERKGNISTKILSMCPNVKTMTLHFHDSQNSDDNLDISFPNDSFKCTKELKKLHDFSFEPIIKNDSNSCHADAIEFYLNMFKEIVLSSENLKNVSVKTVQITDYLRTLTDDSEVANRLRQVTTQFEPCKK